MGGERAGGIPGRQGGQGDGAASLCACLVLAMQCRGVYFANSPYLNPSSPSLTLPKPLIPLQVHPSFPSSFMPRFSHAVSWCVLC